MKNENIDDYIVSLYSHSVTSIELEPRDAQNVVSDIMIAMLINELPTERKDKIIKECGCILRSATAINKPLKIYHEAMLGRLNTITRIAHAINEESEENGN